MDLGLRDRVAIVGGSTRGVGRAIATALVREGASVTICGRNEHDLRHTEIELARIASQHHVLAIPADLSEPRAARRVVRDTVNRFGQVGILVGHVWYGSSERPSELSDETMRESFEQNYMSAVRLSREVVPYMKQQRWGRIIHWLPTDVKQPAEYAALSASSQVGLVAYLKVLSSELARFNITVNNVVSGPIETEWFASSLEAESEQQSRSSDDVLKEKVDDIPMGRLGRPEEIGDLVTFLASDRAGYMTGTNVVIDGGMLRTLN